ncbi:acyltransferase domain-containing protein [Kitasatospora sp. NPDC050467]|uniref:acyltransferase domain-containing protein n=1 Tax=Kitasatospora sp. NPDC050467 TaxID=3364053 RepID=UPI0037941E7E
MSAPSALPDAEQLLEALLGLAVPFEDVNGLLAARRRLARDQGMRADFDAALRTQVAAIGTVGQTSGLWGGWPEGSDGTDYLATLLLVALAPYTRAYHQALGIRPEVTRATLADLGRHLALNRGRGRSGGLANPSWLTLHFRGELYQLGRLQFQRKRLTGPAAAAAATEGFGPWCLELHVPAHCGPDGTYRQPYGDAGRNHRDLQPQPALDRQGAGALLLAVPLPAPAGGAVGPDATAARVLAPAGTAYLLAVAGRAAARRLRPGAARG